jgi:hypothetical protein
VAAPIDVGIAPFLVLGGSYIVRFTAVDPTTGATVPNVVISGATVQFDQTPTPLPAVANTATFLPGPAFE